MKTFVAISILALAALTCARAEEAPRARTRDHAEE